MAVEDINMITKIAAGGKNRNQCELAPDVSKYDCIIE